MLSKSDYRYFKKAKMAATISDYKKTHIGCIAVYQGNVIGIGCNTIKTHPIQKYYNRYRNSWNKNGIKPTLHAEINCLNSIRHLDINFQKVKLYIFRTRFDKEFGMCRPCPSCMASIKDLFIKHIYYTSNDGYSYECIKN
mgnify:FL=1